jgi:hypothetical protein
MGKFKDFSRETEMEDVEIKVDGDTFYATGIAPALAVLDMAAVNDAGNVERMKIVMEFLDAVMHEESAERFAARLRSTTNPISVDQAVAIVMWLMEDVYATERPTEGRSPSQDGSATTGPNSTDGARPTGLTPVN